MTRLRKNQRIMKTKRLLCILGSLAWLIPSLSSAQSFGLKFAATDPDVATSSLNPTDVAGVVPAANWNNLIGPTGTNVSGLFYDNGGTPVASGATVTWTSPNTWRSGANNAFPAGPNKILTSGYLDTGDTAANGISITVNNLDTTLRTPAYDVYVYFVSDSGDNRGGGYTINDGVNSIVKYGSTLANPTGFVQDPGTDINNSIDGTYLRFRGLTGSSFTLTSLTTLTTPNGFRAPINAIQIIGGTSLAPGPGDVNEDGFTNLVDYNIIRTNLEKPAAIFTNGDLNGDSYVDLNDFRLWRSAAPPAIAALVGVPEPSTAMLTVVASALVAQRLRRRNS